MKEKVTAWLSIARENNASYIVMVLIMAVMPLNNRYLPPLMILLVLCWINDNYLNYNALFSRPSKGKFLFLLFMLLFIWQTIGLTYSSDLRTGIQNLSSRLAMILLPLVLFNNADRIQMRLKTLLRIFTLSTVLYLIICFSYAAYRSVSLQNGLITFNPHPVDADWENYFYNNYLTFSVHPSYMAMYALLSFFIAIESARDKILKLSFRFCWLAAVIFIFIALYFISSRAALLAMLIIIPFYLIYNMAVSRHSRILWISLTVLLLFSVPFIMKNERYKSFINNMIMYKDSDARKNDERIIIWTSALKIIKENLVLGVGIGDTRDELVKEYDLIGAEKQSANRMNAHNQFLQYFLESGLIGLIFFVAVFCQMFYIALSEKNIIYFIFIITAIVFFLFESVLYRFAGISFFSIFSFLLIDSRDN